MKMKVFDHVTLLTLNDSSIKAGRSQNLGSERIPATPQDHYWVNYHLGRESDNREEVRLCVVLDLFAGQTSWLDVSSDEFAAIPEVDISEEEWETAMCAGTPPSAS